MYCNNNGLLRQSHGYKRNVVKADRGMRNSGMVVHPERKTDGNGILRYTVTV